MMRRCFIVLAFSLVASSLTLTATVARSATPQARAQSDEDAETQQLGCRCKGKKYEKETSRTTRIRYSPLRRHAA